VFRPATICGYSTRQRFDLAVNILTAQAIVDKKIRVFGGSQFRPNLHIEDMVDAYLNVLEAPEELIHRNIFNVGGDNLSIDEIASTIKNQIDPRINVEYKDSDDLRSYRIDSNKIKNLIGFYPKRGVVDAVNDIKLAFMNKLYEKPYLNEQYINISMLKKLNLA
jgi:nucleoside-diphosphate-sugar epimerase